jgi:CheY-like chemotaxis protein
MSPLQRSFPEGEYMKILIVDDNADDRKFLKFNLEHRGCEVIEATNGAEGLHLASVNIPDIIVSDALMPVMDGFQFLRSTKKNETLQSISFIFYSAVYTGDKESELAMSLGAEAFIVKPKDPQEFWEELQGIVEASTNSKVKTVSAGLIDEEKEEEYLRKYSHIVATKLEEKVEEIQRLNAELEQRVKERTAELEAKIAEVERLNRLFVDRELRMKELKEQIKELEKKCGVGGTQ